jgi:hypothetical protein
VLGLSGVARGFPPPRTIIQSRTRPVSDDESGFCPFGIDPSMMLTKIGEFCGAPGRIQPFVVMPSIFNISGIGVVWTEVGLWQLEHLF